MSGVRWNDSRFSQLQSQGSVSSSVLIPEPRFTGRSQLNSAHELRQLAEDAGFKNVRIRFEHRTMRYPARFVVGWVTGAPITAQFLALPDDRKRAFIADIVERVATYVDDAGLAVPMENHIVTASK